MNKTTRARLVKWLEHAYAMEKEAETMLAVQVTRLKNYHVLSQRMQEHVGETRQQADAIAGCLQRHNAARPAMMGALASAMAAIHATENAVMSDEVIKALVMSYAFEHMEIAVYTSVILAARQAGDNETAVVCGAILEQERAMADWLGEHLEPTVHQFLEHEQSGDAAKR
ncbi:ferritin-like domain-containing protein [Stenotrophomonas acidaminiphila]